MYSILKNVARHTIIYAIADLLRNGIAFFMIPLYTYYLTTSDYGTLELLDLTGYVVGLFLAMGISQSMVRFYYEYDDEESKKLVVSVSLITVCCVVGFSAILLIFFAKTVSLIVFEDPGYARLFRILFITLALQLSSRVPLTLLRIKQRSVLYVSINLVSFVIMIALNILFIVHYGMGVFGILLSSLMATGVTGLFLLVYIFRYIRIQYSFVILKRMLRYSVPLIGSWFGMFILNFGDRFIIQRLSSLSEVGIYSLSYKFGMMLNILILSPFLMVWEPKRFDLLKDPEANKIYSKFLTYLMYVEIFVALGVALLIKDVIHIIADPKFHDAYRYVPLILGAYVCYGAYIYVQFGVHVAKKTRHLAIAAIGGAAINIALNLTLIPVVNIWGAAISTFAAFLFLLVYIYRPSQRYYRVKYEIGRIFKLLTAAGALYVTGSLINPDHIAVSIAVKTIIACLFPFVLYAMRFYSSEELAKLFSIRKGLIRRLRGLGYE